MGIPFEWLLDRRTHIGDKCLVWPFGLFNDGYGQLRSLRGVTKGAHTVMCELAHGAPPEEGMQALHKCINCKACVNPNHLYWGFRKQTKPGAYSARPEEKLTEEAVRVIRKSRLTHMELSKQYGVHKKYIAHIRSNATWKELSR